jgi:hypothetical protein
MEPRGVCVSSRDVPRAPSVRACAPSTGKLSNCAHDVFVHIHILYVYWLAN